MDRRAKITGVSLSRLIKSPCVNVLGFATPGTLGEAVGEANITDGLLGRALFTFGNADAHARRVYTAFELPKFVNERGAEIAEAVRASVFDDGIKIAINKDADARLEQLTTELDLTARKHTSPYAVSLTIRAIEKLERVTGVLAVWEAPGAPAITLEHVEWARTLVASSDAAVLRFVENHMHGGRVQANAAKVLDLIRRVLSGELKPDRASESVAISEGRASRSLILKRSKLSSSDLDEAARHLEATEQIAVECSRNTSGTLGTFAAATYVLR